MSLSQNSEMIPAFISPAVQVRVNLSKQTIVFSQEEPEKREYVVRLRLPIKSEAVPVKSHFHDCPNMS